VVTDMGGGHRYRHGVETVGMGTACGHEYGWLVWCFMEAASTHVGELMQVACSLQGLGGSGWLCTVTVASGRVNIGSDGWQGQAGWVHAGCQWCVNASSRSACR
jgi:hypothetical protein